MPGSGKPAIAINMVNLDVYAMTRAQKRQLEEEEASSDEGSNDIDDEGEEEGQPRLVESEDLQEKASEAWKEERRVHQEVTRDIRQLQ